MIRAAIGNPYAVVVGVLIMVIFSVIAYTQIPVQLKPTIDPLEYNITTTYAGASALEIEDQITNKLERELASTNNLKTITSQSNEGQSTIDLLFNDDADHSSALLDIVQAVARVKDLPDDADKPVIAKANSNGDQIMWIAVEGNSSIDQKFDLMDQLVEPALLRVDGVGGLLVSGGTKRRIMVQPNQDEMSARGITTAQLGAALNLENNDVLGGQIDEGEREFNVRTMGKFLTLDAVRRAVVRNGPDGTVTVGDIATVKDGRERATSFVRIDGQDGMALRILRQSGANTVTTINGAQKVLDDFNKQFADEKIDVKLVVAYSDLYYVNNGIHLVWHDLLLGAVLAAIVLALFLRSGRPILITVVSIPISLVSVFLMLAALHRTINIIALAGLAFAVGLVVDDAIVALENIERHMQELGKPPAQAALEGVEEVWGAILSSTLVRVAVFIPIVLNVSEAGLLFKDIAIAIVTSIMVSLIVTLTVVPSFAALLLRSESGRKRLEHTNPRLHAILNAIEFQWLGEWIQQRYSRFTQWACHGRGAAHNLGRLGLLAAVLCLFLASLTLLPPANYLPNGSQGFITAQGQPNVGQAEAVSLAALEPVAKVAEADPKVGSVFTIASPRFTVVGVRIKPEMSSDKEQQSLVDSMKKAGSKVAGFRTIFPTARSIFRIQDKQFTIEINGPDLDQLSQIANQIIVNLNARPDIIAGNGAVRSSYLEGVPELQVHIDPYRARELGMHVSDVAAVVQSMIAGTKFSTYTDAGQDYDLVIQGDPDVVKTRDDMAALLVETPSGQRVRLDEIADVIESSGPSSVNHYNRQRNIELTVNTRPDVPTATSLQKTKDEVIAPVLKTLPVGYTVIFGEAADKLNSTFKSLIYQGLLAVVIIYLLLVAMFRSFYYPFIVLITIPLAWSGSFLAIALAFNLSGKEVQFDVLGMLGLIILSGIVAANSILIIAQMINFEKQGLPPNEALRESASTRLRPIMMTVLAAVFGMLPLALGEGSGSELYRGLGIVVVGGLISSTIFTLLVVPTMMSLVNDMQTSFKKRGQGPGAEGQG